ncbi:MAG: hypothetical protein ABSG82_05445 [Sedimentisphaerales bacterium]|jgi:hypothetical protein
MDNLGSKVVGVLVILVIIVVIGTFVVWIKSGVEEAQKPEHTFSDMVKKDQKEMLAEPNAKDLTSRPAQPESPAAGEETQPKAPAANESAKTRTPAPPAQNQPAQPVEQEKKAEPPPMPTTLYFTNLDETEQIEAEQLFAMMPAGRSIGRLPMTGFHLMVETSRQIMGRWPGSIYDYKARRALGQIPERFRERYKITEQDLDLTQFTKPRPNTSPYTIKGED